MEQQYIVRPIGVIRAGSEGFRLELEPEYCPALEGLEGYSHLQVLWWFDRCDNAPSRAKRWESKPYTNAPDRLGTFATRAPERPNPLALSCAGILGLDRKRGVVALDYLDAEDSSPVLDLKPYVPSLDRVERPAVPDWCAHWPECVEKSGDFDWAREFLF